LNPKTIKQLVTLLVVATLWISTIAAAVDEATTRQTEQQKPAVSGRAAAAKDDSNRVELENAVLKMIVIPRTREQMKAFYEGRGFPKPAIAAIAEACFMTVIVKNKTDKVLWLELDNWQTSSAAADAKRLNRGFWKQRWENLDVPMANRSTFGWTLLPERRDLRAGEGVGGNITLTYTDQPFKLIAQFSRGEDKQDSPITVQLDQLQCIK
jgi:hypothetical protein